MPPARGKRRSGLLLIMGGMLLAGLGLGRSAWSILAAPAEPAQAAVLAPADPAAILYRHALPAGAGVTAQEDAGNQPQPDGLAEGAFIAPDAQSQAPLPARAPRAQQEGLAESRKALATLQPGPTPAPPRPTRLVIAAINLDVPVVEALRQQVTLGGKVYEQWLAPDQPAVGWHTSSALLGQPGNTVLNGHHNEFGEVFRQLVDLKVGDTILVYAAETPYRYVIVNRMILPERGQSLAVRLENARWIGPATDERLTLVTCWPYESNTHRLVLVAVPVQ